MSELDDDERLGEIDRMLNDPDAKMEPARIWSLLAELAQPAAPPLPARIARQPRP